MGLCHVVVQLALLNMTLMQTLLCPDTLLFCLSDPQDAVKINSHLQLIPPACVLRLGWRPTTQIPSGTPGAPIVVPALSGNEVIVIPEVIFVPL